MPRLVTLILMLGFAITANAQSANPNYDADLAKRLGADDYGMKSYVLVILKTGPVTDAAPAVRDSLFRGHMSNMGVMVENKQLVIAGPIGRNANQYRGIFILNMTDMDAARELLQTDPAINGGLLAADLYPWYGSAALAEYLPASDKIWKTNP
ncbi:MAG: hypothetical protein RL177_932 [Bacteroidota bacterium]